MKKTYVKPVMDSEEFVANEYVAACYLFFCEGCRGEFPVKYNKEEETTDPTIYVTKIVGEYGTSYTPVIDIECPGGGWGFEYVSSNDVYVWTPGKPEGDSCTIQSENPHHHYRSGTPDNLIYRDEANAS